MKAILARERAKTQGFSQLIVRLLKPLSNCTNYVNFSLSQGNKDSRSSRRKIQVSHGMKEIKVDLPEDRRQSVKCSISNSAMFLKAFTSISASSSSFSFSLS